MVKQLLVTAFLPLNDKNLNQKLNPKAVKGIII